MDLNYLAWTVPALFLPWRGHAGESALPTVSYRYEVISLAWIGRRSWLDEVRSAVWRLRAHLLR
jgi:hypothetical protein